MIIKASGRSALILITGIFVCFAEPSQAARADDAATASSEKAGAPIALNKYAKSRQSTKYAQRKSGKVALKSSASKRAADVADNAVPNSTEMPASVANANAQLASAGAPAGSALAMSAKANTMLLAAAADTQAVADTQVVAADQLNDLDRALQESKSAAPTPAPTLAMAAAETRAPVAPVMASSKEDFAWDQTSLIGKIFIAFGALLTMASAARMFMA